MLIKKGRAKAIASVASNLVNQAQKRQYNCRYFLPKDSGRMERARHNDNIYYDR
jgi:hypothetical protein